MANPFSVQCPNCDARLKIQNPKAVGKKVRCPNCQNPFTVKAPKAAPPENEFGFDDYEDDFEEDYEDYEDYDAPPRRSSARRSSPSRGSARRPSPGKKKSRRKTANKNLPLIIGGGVMALLLLVGLGFLISSALGGSAVDFAWLPPNSQMVVSIDVDEVWNASVVQRGLNNPDVGFKSNLDQMKKMLEEVGFEEGESIDAIDSVTLGFEDPDKQPLGVICKKSPWNIEALKTKHNLEEQTHEGKTYYKMRRDALFFPDAKTLVVGREQLVKDAMTRGPESNLGEKFSFLPKGQVVIGFLPEDAEKLKKNFPNPGGMMGPKDKPYAKDIAEGVREVQGGALVMNFGSGMEFEVVAKCSNSSAASKLSGGLQEALADARKKIDEERDSLNKMPEQFRELVKLGLSIFDTVSASKSGDNVVLTAEISASVIDGFERLAKDRKGGGGLMPPFFPGNRGFDLGKLLGGFGGGPGGGGGGLGPIAGAGEANLRIRDKENLKKIGMAFHNHHDAKGKFPPADGQNAQLSWRVHLLPYLGHPDLYNQFKLNEPWNSPDNLRLINQMPDIYRRPGSILPVGKTSYVGISGKGGMMENGGGKRIFDITDGTANTILVAEVEDHAAVTWTQPVDYVYQAGNPIANLGGWNGGFNALFCDGSVQFIAKSINPQTLLNLFQMNDGNPVSF